MLNLSDGTGKVTLFGKEYPFTFDYRVLESTDLTSTTLKVEDLAKVLKNANRQFKTDSRNETAAKETKRLEKDPEIAEQIARDRTIKHICDTRKVSLAKAERIYERMLELEDDDDE